MKGWSPGLTFFICLKEFTLHDHSARPKIFYGYILVAAAFVLQAVGWGLNNSFGVFFNPLLNEFGWPRAVLSGAASMSFLVYGFLSIF